MNKCILFLTLALFVQQGAAQPVAIAGFSGQIGLGCRGVGLSPTAAVFNYANHLPQALCVDTLSNTVTAFTTRPTHSWSFFQLIPLYPRQWIGTDRRKVWLTNDAKHWQLLSFYPGLVRVSDPAALATLAHIGLLYVAAPDRIIWGGPKDLTGAAFMAATYRDGTSFAAVREDRDDGRARIIMSNDGGKHWRSYVPPGSFSFIPGGDYQVQHVFALDGRLWISSDVDDGMYSTVDGNTWHRISLPDRIVQAMYFRTPRDGIILAGSKCRIFETKDGGGHWRELSDNEVASPNFIDYFRNDKVELWNDFAVYHVALNFDGKRRNLEQ